MVSSFLFFNHFSGFLLDHFLVLIITQKLKSPKPGTGSCKGVSTVKIGSIYGALNSRPSTVLRTLHALSCLSLTASTG